MNWENELTVSELNEYARLLMANDPLLRGVRVQGEISGYKNHISGHRYFYLKDAQARVQCVMFRQYAQNLDFRPQDGMKVTVQASASIFPRDGNYQLYVSAMKKDGAGTLFEQFEKLKRRLQAEGLFDPARKKILPSFPKRIGIVTALTGAAVHDMINVSRRRNPNIEIIVSPCQVQGEGAAKDIARALKLMDEKGGADVILLGRGGGSIEDLWAFNEEIVAYAIAQCETPVISCVGHETDFTIADFVSDMRAPTPSAAAEIAVPESIRLKRQLDMLSARLANSLCAAQQVRRSRLRAAETSLVFSRPREALLSGPEDKLARLDQRLLQAMDKKMLLARTRLEMTNKTLLALDPGGVLNRGYAYVTANGQLLHSAEMLQLGDRVQIHMQGGSALAAIEEVELEKE